MTAGRKTVLTPEQKATLRKWWPHESYADLGIRIGVSERVARENGLAIGLPAHGHSPNTKPAGIAHGAHWVPLAVDLANLPLLPSQIAART